MQRDNRYKKRLFGWRMKRDSGMQSTQTNSDQTKSSEQTSLKGSQTPVIYHQSCEKLIYGRFMEIMVNGKLDPLIISGKPTQEQLMAAWEIIISEYCDLIKTDKSATIFDLYHKILKTQWQISYVEVALAQLKEEYDLECANRLVELGYDFIDNLPDREAYLKQIYFVQTQAKFLFVMLVQHSNEYKMMCPSDSSPIQRTLMDFQKDLSVLSRFSGFKLDKNNLFVFEYCAIVNDYIENGKQEAHARGIL